MEQLRLFFDSLWLQIIIAATIGYLLGSVNFSIIITKIVSNNTEDIRDMGSGNAGFTNVLRTVGKTPAVITMVCDYLKAVIAVVLSYYIFSAATASSDFVLFGKYIAGYFCILGHMFPCYFGFRGGKGVVTTVAMMSVYDLRIFALAFGTFIIAFIISRIISLSSIIGCLGFVAASFIVTYFCDYRMDTGYTISHVYVSTIFAALVAILVIYRHKGNIKRILNGTEKKITAKKR